MKKEDLDFFENLVGKENLDKGFGREYNLFAMEQAIVIAEALQTKEAIIEFKDKGWDEQKKLVPGLDDGHSGNTFGMALRFAIAYLPQLVANRRDDRIDSVIN
jgi:hypothetical protein